MNQGLTPRSLKNDSIFVDPPKVMGERKTILIFDSPQVTPNAKLIIACLSFELSVSGIDPGISKSLGYLLNIN